MAVITISKSVATETYISNVHLQIFFYFPTVLQAQDPLSGTHLASHTLANPQLSEKINYSPLGSEPTTSV